FFKVYFEKGKGRPDETLTNVYEILEKSLQRVREFLADLRPAAISPDGLFGDLRWEVDDFARLYGIRVELLSIGTEDMLVFHHREADAQVVREAPTNVRRHS